MSRKLLTLSGLIILVVAAFAIGWFLATRFGFGPAFGMMGYGGFGMHPNLRAMPFGHANLFEINGLCAEMLE